MTTRADQTAGPAAVEPPRLLDTGEPDTFRVPVETGHPYLAQHLVQGRRVLPGVACLEMALRGAARVRPGARPFAVRDAAWLRPVYGDEPLDELSVAFRTAPGARETDYTVTNRGALCAMGTLLFEPQDRALAVGLEVRDEICAHTRSHLTRAEIYEEFSNMGIDYGPYFRRNSYVQRHGQRSLAWLSHNDGTRIGLVNLLDCAFQSGMAISIGEHRDSLMPFSMGHMVFHAPTRFPLGSAFVLTEKLSPFRTNFTLFDEDYEPLLSVFDLGVKPAL
ncbi:MULTISPECIES: polyketide synthase dehydratase domain-containing protein [Streptomyces]|uniref:Polyketide synthase dehydratase n=1 Tax=Streptomyces griseofuscus TaxID=146922 RepID=A0A7H1QCU2_9ACTN|nr:MULTISPECIES: polyketide synthase dehydratase domain-containing protein [Streptomyces]MBA9050700.1 acyl transferase domain-containing protein [Streptomyces murinus]QNT98122.1 Polyketide synthase dehydratase [Streptomyces griseofuscus]